MEKYYCGDTVESCLKLTPKKWMFKCYPGLLFAVRRAHRVNYRGQEVNLRDLLNEFDNVVNPVLAGTIKVEDLDECAKKVEIFYGRSGLNISGSSQDGSKCQTKYGCLTFQQTFESKVIKSNESSNGETIKIKHGFYEAQKIKSSLPELRETGEVLEVFKYSKDGSERDYIQLNLVDGMTNRSGYRGIVTPDELVRIVTYLKESIELIKENNIKKMVEPSGMGLSYKPKK